MKKNGSIKLPGRSVAYLLICGFGVLAFILLGIYPNQKKLASLDKETNKISGQIEKHKILFPLYKNLLDEVRRKDLDVLPFPKKTKFAPDKTDRITFVFREIAKKSNLEVVSVAPDVKSMDNEAGLLLINTSLKGDFFSFRKFLIELGKVSYLERIEEIQVQAAQGFKEFRAKIWLALDK